MRYFQRFVFAILLLTTPVELLALPPIRLNLAVEVSYEKELPPSLASFEHLLELLDEIESGSLEQRCTDAELKKLEELFASLAKEGAVASQQPVVDQDIVELLGVDPEQPMSSDLAIAQNLLDRSPYVMLCKGGWFSKRWGYVKRFIRRHRKEIVIGAVIVAVTTLVLGAVASSAAAAAAVAAQEAEKEKLKQKSSTPRPKAGKPPQPTLEPQPINHENAPLIKEVVESYSTTFKEIIGGEESFVEMQNTLHNPEAPTHSKARQMCGYFAHEMVNVVATLVEIVPNGMDDIAKIAGYLPDCLKPPFGDYQKTASYIETFDQRRAAIHQCIDKWAATDLADHYTRESLDAKAERDRMLQVGVLPFPGAQGLGVRSKLLGTLPPPCQALRAANLPKVRQIVKASRPANELAQEFGFNKRQIEVMKIKRTLDSTLNHSLDKIITDRGMRESWVKFEGAQLFLRPYKNQYLPEVQVRELIHKAGINTFPRPKGIPENFRVRVSDRGAGMVYSHPNNPRIDIRVMPGKPYSEYLHQQKPYVIFRKEGKVVNKIGKQTARDAADAHIQLDEFVYIEH